MGWRLGIGKDFDCTWTGMGEGRGMSGERSGGDEVICEIERGVCGVSDSELAMMRGWAGNSPLE